MRLLLMATVALAVLSQAGMASAQEYRGPARVDFDERLVKGQTSKANSVYIYARQQSEIKSLVGKFRTFRKRIIRTVFED